MPKSLFEDSWPFEAVKCCEDVRLNGLADSFSQQLRGPQTDTRLLKSKCFHDLNIVGRRLIYDSERLSYDEACLSPC